MTEVDRALSPDFEQIAEQVRAAAQAAGHALIDATTRLELVKQTSAVVESLGAPIPGIEIAPNAIAQNEAEVQQAAYDAAIMAAIAAPVIEGAADTLADIPLEELYRRLGVTEPAAEAEEPQPEQPADTQQPAAENPDGDEAPEDKTVRETPAAERASHARGKKSPAKKSAGSTPGGTETRKGGKQPSSATIHARNETLIALLNANGTITAEDGKSAGVVVRDRRGLLPKDTNNALTKLMASGLVTAVKPHERFIGELHLDVELLEKLIATGEADPAVVASYEAFQERKASGDERLKVEGVGVGTPRQPIMRWNLKNPEK